MKDYRSQIRGGILVHIHLTVGPMDLSCAYFFSPKCIVRKDIPNNWQNPTLMSMLVDQKP